MHTFSMMIDVYVFLPQPALLQRSNIIQFDWGQRDPPHTKGQEMKFLEVDGRKRVVVRGNRGKKGQLQKG
jgi:hypothetical protein